MMLCILIYLASYLLRFMECVCLHVCCTSIYTYTCVSDCRSLDEQLDGLMDKWIDVYLTAYLSDNVEIWQSVYLILYLSILLHQYVIYFT
jgi:hypothetical protein